ncbi:TPA: SAM-dependent methyltransferase [Candidatus Woesebacteria bacterium]|nr:SAM-dependent methyltransferase [Candidatus Woesebacteria bacterium]
MTNEQYRIEWVSKKLKKQIKNQKIIDVGAGECQYKKFCTHLRYTSQDINEYNPKAINVGLQMPDWNNRMIDIVSDITKIPVKNKSFDVVLCTEVLEHVINPESAIKEISRITKNGGKLILTAPFCSLTHFAPYHYATGFNRYFFYEVLKKYGFRIIEISSNGNYFSYLQQEIQRTPQVIKNYVNPVLGKILFPLYYLLSLSIQPLIRYGNKSSELLTFGYHIYAEKTDN